MNTSLWLADVPSIWNEVMLFIPPQQSPITNTYVYTWGGHIVLSNPAALTCFLQEEEEVPQKPGRRSSLTLAPSPWSQQLQVPLTQNRKEFQRCDLSRPDDKEAAAATAEH